MNDQELAEDWQIGGLGVNIQHDVLAHLETRAVNTEPWRGYVFAEEASKRAVLFHVIASVRVQNAAANGYEMFLGCLEFDTPQRIVGQSLVHVGASLTVQGFGVVLSVPQQTKQVITC